MNLKKKHQKILDQVRRHPKPSNLKWKDFEALIIALGFELDQSAGGSLKIFQKGELEWFYHRPHPRPDVDKGAIADLDKYLKEHGLI